LLAYSVLSDNVGLKAVCGPMKHHIRCFVCIGPHLNPNHNPNPQSWLTLTLLAACQTTNSHIYQNVTLGMKFAIYD